MKPVVAPIGLDYLAQWLKMQNMDVDLLDLAFEENLTAGANTFFSQSRKYDVIGISIRNTDDCFFASQDFFIPEIKKLIEQVRTKIDAPIVLGGSGFSVMPQRILEYCGADLGIVADGEGAFEKIIENLGDINAYSKIDGLIYKDNGKIFNNGANYLDMKQFPEQRRDTIDNFRYFQEGGMGGIETKRGCYKECIYCADFFSKGRHSRLRSPRNVVNEIEVLLDQGIDYFHTCDSEFNLPESHAREVCQEIIRRGLGARIHWYAYASPVPFPDELAASMKKAGCEGINFGVDSGCDSMLKTLGRDFGKEDLKKTVRTCQNNGIVVMYDLLLGGPGETKETVRETIDFMQEVKPDRVGFSLGVRIYPGTRMAQIIYEEGLKNNNNLYGMTTENDDFFEPIFYISSRVGKDIFSFVRNLVGDDNRFFFPSGDESETNYNYNQNIVLINAIRNGCRGAFWDILRKVSQK